MNTIIKILGTGCPNCIKTINLVREVVQEYKLDACVEKIEDIPSILEYDILTTPAVVVNEKVVLKGHVPSKAALIKVLVHSR